MTEAHAKQVATIINDAHNTTEAEARTHGNSGWIVVLGPNVGKWYPILHEIAKQVVETSNAGIQYTVAFDPPSTVSSIHFHD